VPRPRTDLCQSLFRGNGGGIVRRVAGVVAGYRLFAFSGRERNIVKQADRTRASAWKYLNGCRRLFA